MNKLILLVLKFFDFFHQRKILKFLKSKKIIFDIFFDVGAHHGETIKIYTKNFDIKNMYCFEASSTNFLNLKKKINRIKFKETNLILENYALGANKANTQMKQMIESSSSTINEINLDSKYFKKKKKLLLRSKNDNFFKMINVQQITLKDYMIEKNINKIDFLKIDTEGYEFEILKGADNFLEKIQFLILEHHYHDMIKKNYKYQDINNLLKKFNFKKIYKAKMFFRKTFEYIYENQGFLK